MFPAKNKKIPERAIIFLFPYFTGLPHSYDTEFSKRLRVLRLLKNYEVLRPLDDSPAVFYHCINSAHGGHAETGPETLKRGGL
jgi:hypothetical protein